MAVPALSRITGSIVLLLTITLAVSACASTPGDGTPQAEPPVATTMQDIEALISDDSPIVLNVWASWCLPCRSEAPMIDAAARTHPNVAFIGLNVRDTPTGAAAFITEFLPETPMIHLADDDGTIPVELGGGRGVPITFFFARTGELVHVHRGVIDEPTLATYLDEIDR